jgi:Domain of unknown function (DUF5658)
MTRRAHETWRGAIWAAAREHSVLQAGIVCLLGLSVADLLITHSLLRRSPHFYESNPVASWFLRRWNFAGLTMFKFGVIGLVIAVAELVERRRPGRGWFVLLIGSVATGAVVVHGLRLLYGPTHVE